MVSGLKKIALIYAANPFLKMTKITISKISAHTNAIEKRCYKIFQNKTSFFDIFTGIN